MKTSLSLRLLLNDFGNNKRLFSKKSQSCTLPPNDCLLLNFTGFEISFSLWWNKGLEHIYLFYLVERSFEITKMPFVYPRCDKWIKECYKNETHHVTSFQIMTKFWKAISILEITCKLPVITVVSDGASPKRKFYSLHAPLDELNTKCVTYRTINLFEPKRYICFFCRCSASSQNS